MMCHCFTVGKVCKVCKVLSDCCSSVCHEQRGVIRCPPCYSCYITSLHWLHITPFSFTAQHFTVNDDSQQVRLNASQRSLEAEPRRQMTPDTRHFDSCIIIFHCIGACYYPHMLRELLLPVCGILFIHQSVLCIYNQITRYSQCHKLNNKHYFWWKKLTTKSVQVL